MSTGNGGPRVGVYVCHCGTNIASVVSVADVVDMAQRLPHVTVARDYKYMCSDPGQELIKRDIRELGIDRVVVAACSPLLHEKTFRRAARDAGLNPFLVQLANIREHIAWVSTDKALALRRARSQLAGAVSRVVFHEPLERKLVPITSRVLVVGGGIAGIQAALTMADAGKEVVLVEREPTIGGHMAQFDKTFPTLDCAACILTPKMTAVKDHPNIRLLSYSEVENVEGSVGNYRVTVRRRARYIDESLCVGCMECIDACVMTARWDLEFDAGLSKRKPVYIPFPQAVPPVPVIDRETCVEFKSGRCKKTCIEACGDRNAIDLSQSDQSEQFEVGAVIVATGYQPFDPSAMLHYGYGTHPNVYTALEVERLLNAAGPTKGKVTLRDGREPGVVGIVHCVGSRDAAHHKYCSRVCCMYSLKLAQLVREKTNAEVFNFYIDMRAPGKGFEEFYERAQLGGVHFVRGKVGEVVPSKDDSNRMVLSVDDTLLGRLRRIQVDMLILATALEPQRDADAVRRLLGMSCSSEGFFLEKHPKLAPVNTAADGILVAGACQGPKDIPDTVAQADAAAGQALSLIDAGHLELEPNTAEVNADACSGCKTCIPLCPYGALQRDAERRVVRVDETLCKGCGTCVAACPSGAADQHLFTNIQIYEEIEGMMSHAAAR